MSNEEDNYSKETSNSLNNLEKMSYVLGSELLGDNFGSLYIHVHVVKKFLIDVWESRKLKVLAPSLTPWGEILVRVVNRGMVGMAGVVSSAIAVMRLVHILICMYVCVALPIVSAWSMAVLL